MGHQWRFAQVGGVPRIQIDSGEDISHLGELDQKLWTVLSCPVSGLEMDEETLRMMDYDGDGKIRVPEVVETAEWLCLVLKDADSLLKGENFIRLSDINRSVEEGKQIYETALHILESLGRPAADDDAMITIADTADSKKVIEATLRENAQNAWMDEAKAGGFADKEDSYKAFTAVREKVDDFFRRCQLVSFAPESKEKLDVAVEGVEGIEQLPLGRVNADCVLDLENLNPAWWGRMKGLKLEGTGLDFASWLKIKSSFEAYEEWSKRKPDIGAGDDALKAEADAIAKVDRLLHLYRDFYQLLRNFVTFSDFYDRERKAIFQCGSLYIDQRCCDLCVKVSDMSAHDLFAAYSGMFLIYCACSSKKLGKKMDIVAVLTMGDVQNIRVGKNALFYDNYGRDWDAVVTKIVDNPISIRQAFYTPYRKLADFIDGQVSKLATAKNDKIMDDATNQIATASDRVDSVATSNATTATADKEKAKQKAAAFDIAKFCGIFAAIGMALGYIGGFLVKCVTSFTSLDWWQMPLAIIGLLLVISGPSMILAWLKLRKRNLSPLLNANGWAINSRVIVNIMFGATLTSLAQIPSLNLEELRRNDPFVKKGIPAWKKVVWCICVLLIIAAAVCGVLIFLGKIKLPL